MELPKSSHVVHNDMQELEHSLEAIIPFYIAKNKQLEIIPILVLILITIDGISTVLLMWYQKF
jgi:predicted class III extradiol MEMO1 family dioxygenase